MRESLVGLGILVHILALSDGCAEVVASIHDLACKAFLHGLFAALAGKAYQPAERQSLMMSKAS